MVQNHFKTMVRPLKRLKLSPFRRVQAFPMYGALGSSAPSLHRESTNSLIPYSWKCLLGIKFGGLCFCWDCANITSIKNCINNIKLCPVNCKH